MGEREETELQHNLLDATVCVPDHVVFRSFGSETLLLNLETGQYHGLNETGGRLIELLPTVDGNLRAAIASLASEYEMETSEIVPDLIHFCREIHQRGLIAISTA